MDPAQKVVHIQKGHLLAPVIPPTQNGGIYSPKRGIYSPNGGIYSPKRGIYSPRLSREALSQ